MFHPSKNITAMKKLLLLLTLTLAGLAPQAAAAQTAAEDDMMDVRFTVTDEKGRPAEGFLATVTWYDAEGTPLGQLPYDYDEYENCRTDMSGQVVLGIPRGQAIYQWRVFDNEERHYYAQLATATEAQLEAGVDVSYEGMHRVDITATGQFDDMYTENFGMVLFNAIFTPEGGEYATGSDMTYVSLCEYDENGGKSYVVCPDGNLNILCIPTMADGVDNAALRTIRVDGEDTAVHFDMDEAWPVSSTVSGWQGEYEPIVSITNKGYGKNFAILNDARLVPGEYMAYSYFAASDDVLPTQYYNVQTFNVTDGPVELNFDMSPAKFHTYTYDVTGAPEGAGFSLAYVDGAKIDLPNPDTYGYRTMLTDGTHHYSVVQLHDAELKLYNCFPIEGEVTLAGADAVVPLDLSGLTFAKLDLGLTNDGFLGYFDGYDYWGGELVAADGRRASLRQFIQPLGVALAPGTYTLEVVVAPGRLFTTKFTVEEGNHFATIDAALEETTGIGTVGQTAALAARVTPAGIVVTSPHGTARATVYGLDGRTVLTQDAADGETIGTAQLPAGTYVLYLRQGSEARVVKFIK